MMRVILQGLADTTLLTELPRVGNFLGSYDLSLAASISCNDGLRNMLSVSAR